MSESSHQPALVGLEEGRIAEDTQRVSQLWDEQEQQHLDELSSDPVLDRISARKKKSCQCEMYSEPEAMLALIRDGIETATDFGQERSVNKGDLSKWSSSMIQKMTV